MSPIVRGTTGGDDGATLVTLNRMIGNLRRLVVDVLRSEQVPRVRWGAIVAGSNGLAVQPGPPYPTTTVQLNQDGVDIPGVRYPAWYTPTIGDDVACHRVGQTDLFVTFVPHS